MNTTPDMAMASRHATGDHLNQVPTKGHRTMPNLPRLAVISSQPDPLIPALAEFLTAHGRPASVLADYLPSPVLSEVEAAMTALGTDAVLNASQR